MVTVLKDRVTAKVAGIWRRVKGLPAPVAFMTVVAPVLAFFSGKLFFTIHGIIGKVLYFDPWVPIIIWVAILLLALIRPFNIAILSLLGTRRPNEIEEEYLMPLWQDVMRRTGVKPGRYVLRVTSHRGLPFDRDLGPYVVTVDEEAMQLLVPGELSAILAQRVSRQTILLGSLLGICLWALMPAVLGLLLAIAILAVIRRIYRSIFRVVDEAVPHVKTEGCAWVTLFALALGIAAFIAFLMVGVFALQFLLIEVVAGVGGVANLARLAEHRADLQAIRLGYGPALAAALEQTAATEVRISGWRNIVNTRPPHHVRISRIWSSVFPAGSCREDARGLRGEHRRSVRRDEIGR